MKPSPRLAGTRLRRWAAAFLCAGLGFVHGAWAQEEPGVAGFHRTLWRLNEGAPVEVRGIAATQDGFLWVGSYTGLYRFDGIRFERFEPPWGQALPSNAISALTTEGPNSLWLAASGGHVVKLTGTRVTEQHELPDGVGHIFRLLIRGGQRYAVTSGGLYQGDARGWRLVTVRQGDVPLRLYDAALQPDGTLWLSSTEGFFTRGPAATTFIHVDTAPAGAGKFSLSQDGHIWYCGESGGLRRFSQQSLTVASNPDFRCYQFFIDTDGMAWVEGSDGSGRVDPNVALSDRDGKAKAMLTESAFGDSTITRSIAQDVEGSIWVGTSNGLSQFHAYRLGRPSFPGGYGGLAPAKGGGLWVASHSRGLIKVGPNEGPRADAGLRLTHIMRDRDGVVWIGGQRRAEILKLDGEALTSVPFEPGGQEVFVSSIAKAADGALWVATQPSPHGRVYRQMGDQWVSGGGIPGIAEMAATSLWSDSRGRVWLGYTDSRLSMVDGSKVRVFDQAPSLRLGSIRKFEEYDDAILVAGDEGMAILLGGQLHPIRLQPPMRILGPLGLLVARNGDVWINQAANLLRIPASQMRMAMQEPDALLGADVFDYRDGREGAPVAGAPHPTIAQTDDGPLWFAAANLTTFDPSTPSPASHARHVSLTQVLADGRPLKLVGAGGINVPAGAEEFTISYTATDLVTPDRLQLRFRLEGIDTEWRIGGHDRKVTYKRPRPGSYSFKVVASNELGLWNDTGTELKVVVQPLYYETNWFKILIALFAVALCGLAVWARSTWLTLRIRERLRERTRERERIARELHDTLLQGIQGLMLHVQSVANDLPEDGQGRTLINRALDRADVLIAEGRQRVSDLRLQEEGIPLGASLRRYLLEGGCYGQTHVQVRETGTPREVAPSVRIEVLRIGAEAAANALQHSGGEHVRIVVRYDRDALRLRVRDDGSGLESAIAESGKPGHWGIKGMQERANAIRATLRLTRSKGGGTTVDLAVPAVIAYGDRRGRWHRAILNLFGRRNDI